MRTHDPTIALDTIASLVRPWRDAQPSHRAATLRTLADTLDRERARIEHLCSEETHLLPAELAPECVRMTRTLRRFAALIERNDWRRPAQSPLSDNPSDAIGPNVALTCALVPLRGAALVMGASNFPLAYGVCGGDTASALAAGLPVLIKEHPAHPQTGRLLASCCQQAGVPLVYVEHTDPTDHSLVASLIAHHAIAAVGFTGSTRAGLAIQRLCRERTPEIPSFCEMGSTNPALLAGSISEHRAREIAHALAQSILARVGQQCTKPGLIVLADEAPRSVEDACVDTLREHFEQAPRRTMLAPWIESAYRTRLREAIAAGALPLTNPALDCAFPAPMLLRAPSSTAQPAHVYDEIFGPACIIARAGDLPTVLHTQGVLACGVWGIKQVEWPKLPTLDWPSGPDAWMAPHAARSGRVVIEGVTTGVRVDEAMVHGGPHTSSNAPHTTAVGPRALERWCRPVTFQRA